jgi:hypothetical protein
MQSNGHQTTRKKIEQILADSHSFAYLDRDTQNVLTDALTQITGHLEPGKSPAVSNQSAVQFASPNLQQQLSPQNKPPVSNTSPNQPSAPSQPISSPSQSATGRVGDVTRATLNAINFSEFVSSLIKGTFQAIVDASIQQMEAYAELLKNVAMSVDQFMSENISDAAAKDYLADQYGGLLSRDVSQGKAVLQVNQSSPQNAEMPKFFTDLGFDSPRQIDDQAIDETIVPATRKSMAERRQQTLATMVLMGINRIVVDEGEILAKLVFHIDASETMNVRFDQSKQTLGNMAGGNKSNTFSGNGIMVNTSSLNAQSDINVRADLTGQVKVKFRSETFPLERFADSMAIQLINENAKVPTPPPVAQNAPSTQPPSVAPIPLPTAPPNGAAKPPTATQSYGDENDPWMPV